MKKRKTLPVVCLSAAVLCFALSAAPAEKAKAETMVEAPEEVEFFDGMKTEQPCGYIAVKNVTSQSYVDAATVQSTDKNVVEVMYVETILRKKAENSESLLWLRINGEGTARVTYRVGSENRTTDVTVKPYDNPIRFITMTNVNGGADFSASTEALLLSETTENPMLHIETDSDWTIRAVYLGMIGENNTLRYDQFRTSEKNSSLNQCDLGFSRLLKNEGEYSESGSLVISLQNTVSGQTQDISYRIR